MKGAVLAGGKGTRLSSITKGDNKAFLTIEDRPLIYFPIARLIDAGIEVIVVHTPSPEQVRSIVKKEGLETNANFYYNQETYSTGQIGAIRQMADDIQGDECLMIFGDNYIVDEIIPPSADQYNLCCMYVTSKFNRNRIKSDFGVIDIGDDGLIRKVEEKPDNPQGNFGSIGVNFFPSDLFDFISGMEDDQALIDIGAKYFKMGRARASIYTGTRVNVNDPKTYNIACEHRRSMIRG